VPAIKRFLSEVKQGRVPQTLWEYDDVGHTQDAKKELLQIFDFNSSDDVFITPKPTALVSRIIELASEPTSIVLDSFAGSGTTAHAVMAMNQKDGGDRRFILVECEDYADTLTAERVRRIINGYEYQGTQKEELLREKITWSTISKDKSHKKLLDQVQSLENLESHRFDAIKKTVKDGELIVIGETRITEKVEGLGGGFTYYTLGDSLDLDKMLTGESLPDYASIGAWLFHTATGEPLDPKASRRSRVIWARARLSMCG
jgi:adenine-specific DNA-methyltransferase